MRLYVSGPVTGMELLNRPAFERAGRRLEAAGYDVLLPHWFVPSGADWERAMRACVETLVKCDGVALLPGWGASRGAKLERRLALALGMEVRREDLWK